VGGEGFVRALRRTFVKFRVNEAPTALQRAPQAGGSAYPLLASSDLTTKHDIVSALAGSDFGAGIAQGAPPDRTNRLQVAVGISPAERRGV
jgi:hypothetical protein